MTSSVAERDGEALRALPWLHIAPPTGRRSFGLRELWHHREVMYFLAQRDVKLRYRQTFLGAAWVLLQPLTTMAVFTVVFGRLNKIDSGGVPYALFALVGLVPWSFFSTSISATALSIVGNAQLVAKIYFPRLAVPLSAALAGLVDLFIGLGLLIGVVIVTGRADPVRLLTLPLLVLLALSAVLGAGVFLAAVNVRYRDVRYVVPFLVQTMLLASPVAYSVKQLPQDWRLVYALNPMVGVLEGFRWALLGTDFDPLQVIAVSTASSLAVLYVGLRYFRSKERSFADFI